MNHMPVLSDLTDKYVVFSDLSVNSNMDLALPTPLLLCYYNIYINENIMKIFEGFSVKKGVIDYEA